MDIGTGVAYQIMLNKISESLGQATTEEDTNFVLERCQTAWKTISGIGERVRRGDQTQSISMSGEVAADKQATTDQPVSFEDWLATRVKAEANAALGPEDDSWMGSAESSTQPSSSNTAKKRKGRGTKGKRTSKPDGTENHAAVEKEGEEMSAEPESTNVKELISFYTKLHNSKQAGLTGFKKVLPESRPAAVTRPISVLELRRTRDEFTPSSFINHSRFKHPAEGPHLDMGFNTYLTNDELPKGKMDEQLSAFMEVLSKGGKLPKTIFHNS